MCSIKDGFKLCTCSDIEEEEADWILQKYNKTNPEIDVMGEVSLSLMELDDKEKVVMIIRELNNRNCFDFDYKPAAKDYLTICMNRKNNSWVEFMFRNNQWVEDNESPFVDWKQKLDSYEHGKIKNGDI